MSLSPDTYIPGHSWFSKMWKKVKKHIRTIAAVVVGVVIAVYAPQLLTQYLGMVKGALSTAMVAGALAGAASGAILTRSFSGAMKGALFGALSAGAANMIGHGAGVFAKVRSYGSVAKATLHGLSRMAIAKLQYGTAKGSFLSGLAGSILGGYVAKNFSQAHIAVKTTIVAIAGGTASALGGGKFSNGAMTGAFIMLFNDLANTYPNEDEMIDAKNSNEIGRIKRALNMMKQSKGITGIKYGSNLSYSEAYNRVLSIEVNNVTAERLLGSLAVGFGGAGIVRAGYGFMMRNPAFMVDAISSYVPATTPAATYGGVVGTAGGAIYGVEKW